MDDRRVPELSHGHGGRQHRHDRARLSVDVRYLAGAGAVAGWVGWAFLRLRPPPRIVATAPTLKNYGAWAYDHLAYSDILTLYRVHHLADHALPYVHVAIEYPVLTGFYMWSAAWLPGVHLYFLASCAGLLACALGSFHLLYRFSPRHATIFALSPLLLIYSLLNWDLLAVVLMLGGWALYGKGRHAWAGVVLSLAVCAKFFPVMLLVYGVVALVACHQRRQALRMAAAATATALVVNLPFAVARFGVWDDFFRFNADRRGGGGIFFALHLVSGWPTGAVDAVSAATLLVAMVVLARLVLRGASPVFAAAAALAAFMLVNKVFSPQYMLWVLVFALLAAWPGWTLALITMAGLLDFANAMITLHLLSTHNPGFGWYFAWIFPIDRLIVLGAIFCGVVASAWQARERANGERGLPAPSPPPEPAPASGG